MALTAGEWIAIVGVAANAVLAIGLNVWQESKRRAGVKVEAENRVAEIGLLREQVLGEAEARQAERRANLTVRQAGYERGGQFGRYHFDVRNLGPAPARYVRLKLVEKGDGSYVEATTEADVGDLAAGEPARRVTAEVPRRYWEETPPPVWPYLSWVDEEGPHGEIKGSQVSF